MTLRAFVFSWLIAAVGFAASAVGLAQPPSIKIAFYNLRGGQGSPALPGHPAPFVETKNCDPRSGPANAWGAGLIQRELKASVGADSAIVAFGVAESYLCAPPDEVLQLLGWKASTDERNGVGLLARYGFARVPEWRQLDTSRNEEPNDTMWVVGAPVCLDASCRETLDVYATHWYGTGPAAIATQNVQAQQTVSFMRRSRGAHVLVGDLNVFEGTGDVCHQHPNNGSLWALREAGYVDGWPAVHGRAEGFTGMTNRRGCGGPEGYGWKRIDYAWSKGIEPIGMTRFGMVPPGDAAPSDHYGIVAEYPRPSAPPASRLSR